MSNLPNRGKPYATSYDGTNRMPVVRPSCPQNGCFRHRNKLPSKNRVATVDLAPNNGHVSPPSSSSDARFVPTLQCTPSAGLSARRACWASAGLLQLLSTTTLPACLVASS